MTDKNNQYAEQLRLRIVEAPKVYKYIPETFIIRTPDPLNFIPIKLVKHFNERMFYNFLHRECFNSCIEAVDDSCFNNCQSKHLTAIQLFKTAVEERRKWEPITSYVNLREYQKRPSHMGVNTPSDSNFSAKLNWLHEKLISDMKLSTKGLEEVFAGGKLESPVQQNIFKLYLNGKFPSYTQKAIERNNLRGRFEEYITLNERYGDKVNDIIDSQKDELSWGHVSGEDFAEAD